MSACMAVGGRSYGSRGMVTDTMGSASCLEHVQVTMADRTGHASPQQHRGCLMLPRWWWSLHGVAIVYSLQSAHSRPLIIMLAVMQSDRLCINDETAAYVSAMTFSRMSS